LCLSVRRQGQSQGSGLMLRKRSSSLAVSPDAFLLG
jgi:hypothetical protein